MITLRLIENIEADYPDFEAWWKAHKFPPIPIVALNTMGLVAEEDGKKLAACWVYTASTGIFCMMEWLVTNPEIAPMKAARAISHLLDFTAQECERRGYQIVLTACRQESLGRIYERNGYTATDKGVTHYMRQLTPKREDS
jgi:hypothetical protein